MAHLIDFAARVDAMRGLPVLERIQARELARREAARVAATYEDRVCAYDGRPFTRKVGGDGSGYCRPGCAAAAARRGG